MDWTIDKIKWSFSGRLMCSGRMREVVCKTVSILPPKIIQDVTNNVWFISEPEDAWAFTFRGSDIKGQHLIFMSDELLNQSEDKIKYTILHEIGHVVLKHKNSMGYIQTPGEINKQETEADRFAKKYS